MNFVIQSTFKKEHHFNLSLTAFALAFTGLFHHVAIGLNAAILLLGLFVLWLIQKPKEFLKFKVCSTALLTLSSIIALAWYGTWDTILWAFLSSLLLHQLLYFPNSSILLFESKALGNLLLSPVKGFYESFTETEENQAFTETKLFKLLVYVLIPICVLLFFASIYKNLNPLFENLYLRFFKAIDFNLFALLVFGTLVGYAVFKPQISEKLFLLDQFLPNHFAKSKEANLHAATEKKVGVVLFALLNLMLGVFLVSDVYFLQEIRTGMANDYSKYVHQGVGLLIFSIVVASAFILFFFREKTNAHLPKGDALKVLAIVWIVLNIAIVLTTVGKNLYYIQSYGLSLKRIGVFMYLSLSIVGLLMVLMKIHFQKTNTYLIRALYWSFFVVLSLCTYVDWSAITTKFNLNQHVNQNTKLDWQYLISLNARNIPLLTEYSNLIHFESETQKEDFLETLNKKADNLKAYNPDIRELSFALKIAQNQLEK